MSASGDERARLVPPAGTKKKFPSRWRVGNEDRGRGEKGETTRGN